MLLYKDILKRERERDSDEDDGKVWEEVCVAALHLEAACKGAHVAT